MWQRLNAPSYVRLPIPADVPDLARANSSRSGRSGPRKSARRHSCDVRSKVVIILGAGLTLLGIIMIPFQSSESVLVPLGLFVLLIGVALYEASAGEMSPAARRWS